MLRPPGSSPEAEDSSSRDDDVARLRARVAELERERDHLVAITDILQEISASLHYVDILQTIARKLGDAFHLDRCAIFLFGDENDVRLVASYEDPTIRNLVVDLNRYPELQRSFSSGETVFVPDALNDPSFKSIRGQLEARNVRSIVVVPIQWQGTNIGAIFIRTVRTAPPFSDAEWQRQDRRRIAARNSKASIDHKIKQLPIQPTLSTETRPVAYNCFCMVYHEGVSCPSPRVLWRHPAPPPDSGIDPRPLPDCNLRTWRAC